MKAILACEKNGGIGFKGSMPWPKQEKDLARFKELTLNTRILMGSGTWEATGMPKPLPNRKNIVVSTRKLEVPEDVDLVDLNTDAMPDVDWLIGGANLVRSLWEHIDEFHLTHLIHEYECDTHLDLERLNEDFYCESSTLCLTHK